MRNDGITTCSHRGRGAQCRPHNRYRLWHYVADAADEASDYQRLPTQIFADYPRRIINEVHSPDVGAEYSANPYQGCEHGCVYCYARNTHNYWGFDAGLDFETKIIIKPHAPRLLLKEITHSAYRVKPLMLSGNTDCYQPIERKLRLTRAMLEVLWQFRHPVSIVTKNALILRDLDLLRPMAASQLVHVTISITTLKESLRRLMEPRAVSGHQRLEVVQRLAQAGIPVNVNIAPIIPFLNSDEIPALVREAAAAGARSCALLLVCLNGDVAIVFSDWLQRHFPDRAARVLQAIRDLHGGSLSDSRFGIRMRGEGAFAQALQKLFQMTYKKYFGESRMPPLDCSQFRKLPHQKLLFD
ncbi:MAG: PA0069 family radical SAM protein [Chitinophagales bacterium]|nr:PA0069 family radical SAM protein [Chitinophagales bacterium]MDW8428198.1 PA0069 family radical SAM protein [Chitinophagales bacterium]